MKKFVLLLALVLVVAACDNGSTDNINNNGNNNNGMGQPIYSGFTNHPEGAKWYIYQTTSITNGISVPQIMYVQSLSTDMFSFAMQKMNISEQEIYSVVTSVSKSSGEYSPNEWDDLSINTHNAEINLSKPLSVTNSSSGVYSFAFSASYAANIQTLIDATELKIEYINTGDTSKNIEYTLPIEFRTAMNTYFK